ARAASTRVRRTPRGRTRARWRPRGAVRSRLDGRGGSRPQLLEPLQPLEGHLLRAQRAMGLARLRIPMPVAAPGPQQAEPQGDVGEAGTEVGIVARVPGFDGVESLALEPLEDRAGAPLPHAGPRGD